MILYRLYEINEEWVEVIGIFQDFDLAKMTIGLLPKKEYPHIYGIDKYDLSSKSDLLNPLIAHKDINSIFKCAPIGAR